ncbi:hypothetical protein K435DRAFT_791387 [Dendrothele bispora CBS 962.96]|uniref:Uncharacterized protein n=1 Tax=Dendrothele bispora (strain CBS 962.96) TaxID=1314807 RepID=A0A4S8MMM6_DENBC|nr:hypothetical protein K435DRAFT_791387 [Dendrothele bispora CBS 962.96]
MADASLEIVKTFDIDMGLILEQLIGSAQHGYGGWSWVTGMGNEGMGTVLILKSIQTRSIEGVKAIHALLKRNVNEKDVQHLTAVSTDVNEDQTFSISNQYFTSHHFAPFEPILEMDCNTIDPLGILAKIAGSDYVYTAENKVEYVQMVFNNSEGSKTKFKFVTPGKFREGNVVEVQFTLSYREAEKATLQNPSYSLLIDFD